MARALGARVYPAAEKEIGFAPVALTREGRASCLAALEGEPVLHWHGDTFDLPGGAARLASTRVCENQAFACGANVLAVQFHPEAGGPGFERWLIGHTLELSAAGVSVARLRAEHRALEAGLRARAEACLGRWLAGLEPG
jgi:GMP synthase (glutamine-hydrolysing)